MCFDVLLFADFAIEHATERDSPLCVLVSALRFTLATLVYRCILVSASGKRPQAVRFNIRDD